MVPRPLAQVRAIKSRTCADVIQLCSQWEFQNKGKSCWTGAGSFVLEVPPCNLRPSIKNSVPCDRIVQRPDLECTITPYFRQKRLTKHQ